MRGLKGYLRVELETENSPRNSWSCVGNCRESGSQLFSPTRCARNKSSVAFANEMQNPRTTCHNCTGPHCKSLDYHSDPVRRSKHTKSILRHSASLCTMRALLDLFIVVNFPPQTIRVRYRRFRHQCRCNYRRFDVAVLCLLFSFPTLIKQNSSLNPR